MREWAIAGLFAATGDLPATGELAWDVRELENTRFYDSSRACLWLGYTLVGEWVEAIASMWLLLHAQVPQARIHVIAEKEAVFAALI